MRNVYLEQLLRQNQLKFSPKEKKVAHHFAGLDNEIMNKTIAELAQEIQVSETTIFNFVKKLGFKGFQQFKIAIATHSQTMSASEQQHSHPGITTAISEADPYTVRAKKTLAIYHTYLDQMAEWIDQATVNTQLEAFRSIKNIYFFGFGTMAPLARFAYSRFLAGPLGCYLLTEETAQRALTPHLTATDGVCLLTPSLEAPGLRPLLQELYQQRVQTLLLTETTRDPALEWVNISLFIPAQEANVDFPDISYHALALAWIDALYSLFHSQTAH